MERLCKIALSVLACLCGSLAFGAESYCALSVEVTAPDGRRPVVLVSAVEQSGRTITRIQRSQDVQFCDLGLLPVTVKVGTDGSCNQVVINEVPLVWREPYHLKVTYDPCPEQSRRLPTPECDFLFRVTDMTGKWIPGAAVQIEPSGVKSETDTSGRALLGTKLGDITATISAPGYVVRSLKTRCSIEKAAGLSEEWVRMAPSSGVKP
jgi:hypothetical protein